MGLPFLVSKKFVLVIGDDGAVLTLVNKGVVESRVFAVSPALSDRRELTALIAKNKNVPIYLMLDTMEQSYTKQTLPAVSSLTIGKLVKKRLDRDFAASDIKGAVLLGRDTAGRRDWIYLFASAPTTNVISDWISYVSSLENKFSGIYMLPLEMENFVGKINKSAFKDKKDIKSWQFIITHNKTGGFRQVVIHNEKVIFTRLIRPGRDTLPDLVAGAIEQETLNTIDYLRRLSFGEEEEINIIAVVSKEIKTSLSNTKIRGKPIMLFTPAEVGGVLGLKDAAGKDDKFADVVIAANFVSSPPVLKLDDPKMRQANTLLMVYNLAFASIAIVVPIFTMYSGYMVFSIMSLNSDIKKLEDDKASIEKKWKDAQKSGEYSIDDSNKISDAITLHQQINQNVTPFDLIRDISIVHNSFALTKSLSWTYNNKQASGAASTPPQPGQPAIANINADFNVEFYNKVGNLEELFKTFDAFTTSVKNQLKDYTVEVSNLPDTVTFDNKEKVIDVQIKVASKTGANASAPAPAAAPPPPTEAPLSPGNL